MKTAIVYHSESGNTAKVAAAMHAALGGESITGAIQEEPSLEGCDLIFVGMPIVQFGAPEAVGRYLAAECAGRRVALFVTHAAPEEMPLLQSWLGTCKQAAAGADLVGVFDCQGQLAEQVRQWMLGSDMPDLVRFAGMAACADGQPDEAALRRAAAFARETVAALELELAGAAPAALA